MLRRALFILTIAFLTSHAHAAGTSDFAGSCLEYVRCKGPAQVCARLHFDPEGILAGQVTAILDVPLSPDGATRLDEAPFIFDTHDEYSASILSTDSIVGGGRQVVESVISFEWAGQTDAPPSGPIGIFDWVIEDLARTGLDGAIGAFDFRAGDFITYIDLETSEVSTLTSDDLEGVSFEPDLAAGDFDGDAFVDATDYTVWRDTLGLALGPEDYVAWRNGYTGRPEPAPEPGAVALLGVATIGGLVRRRSLGR